jgi:hypothetical protein
MINISKEAEITDGATAEKVSIAPMMGWTEGVRIY